MFDFRGMLSAIAGMAGFACGLIAAIMMAAMGNWWGLVLIPALPVAMVVLTKILIDKDA